MNSTVLTMQRRVMHMMMHVSVVFLLLCVSICCAGAAQSGAKRRVEASCDGLFHS
jgi:outer membrane lipoprotein-sorting protein